MNSSVNIYLKKISLIRNLEIIKKSDLKNIHIFYFIYKF